MKALFGNARLPRPARPLRRQLDQLGADRRRRSSTTSPPPSRSARRSGRVASRCRPAISATSSPATSAKRMGLPIEQAGHRHQRQRHPGADARDRALRGARRRPRRPRRRWTSRSRRTSSGCCSRPTAATPRPSAALMAEPRQDRRASTSRRRRSPRSAPTSPPARADEAEVAATIADDLRDDRLPARSAHRRRPRGRRALRASRACRW